MKISTRRRKPANAEVFEPFPVLLQVMRTRTGLFTDIQILNRSCPVLMSIVCVLQKPAGAPE
jgi:hypothetical protein